MQKLKNSRLEVLPDSQEFNKRVIEEEKTWSLEKVKFGLYKSKFV